MREELVPSARTTIGVSGIRSARVAGEGLPAPVAWIECACDPAAAVAQVWRVNRRLPDYARIGVVHVRRFSDSFDAGTIRQELVPWASFTT